MFYVQLCTKSRFIKKMDAMDSLKSNLSKMELNSKKGIGGKF